MVNLPQMNADARFINERLMIKINERSIFFSLVHGRVLDGFTRSEN